MMIYSLLLKFFRIGSFDISNIINLETKKSAF